MPRNLKQWLKYIEGLHPKDIEFGLERVFKIAERINLVKHDPNNTNRWHSFLPGVSVIITGTNGKGSTVAILEQIYHTAGYKVGCITSPHFQNFNERLKINAQNVDDNSFCCAFEVVEAARGDTQLTWFEFTAVASLWLLQQAECDVNILEVGAGGRKDVMNLINADMAIITNVDLDHCQWLGETREEIGREKAGIMRTAKPVIVGAEMPESVLQHANDIKADIIRPQVKRTGDSWSIGNWQNLPVPTLPFPSAVCAVQAVELLPLSVSQADIDTTLTKVTLPGRWEKVNGPCEIILDVAHNPAAMNYIANKISQNRLNGRTLLVLGMLADKDVDQSVLPLIPLIDQWYCVDINSDRPAFSGEELCEKISCLTDKKCYHDSSVEAALQRLLPNVQPQDRVVVTGSFYTVAAAQGVFFEKDEVNFFGASD